jgi:hypothetical protein
MRTTLQHASDASPVRSRRLPARLALPLAAAALIAATGCVTTGEQMPEDTTETTETAAVDPMRAALRDGAHATPEAVGGFCVDGVGVFLSAVDDTAELTLYVVAPAQHATFERPAMYLTSREGDHEMTEFAEFEPVTLKAGESRVFRRAAQGPLMDVFADFVDE